VLPLLYQNARGNESCDANSKKFWEKNVANEGILKDEIKKFKKDEKSA